MLSVKPMVLVPTDQHELNEEKFDDKKTNEEKLNENINNISYDVYNDNIKISKRTNKLNKNLLKIMLKLAHVRAYNENLKLIENSSNSNINIINLINYLFTNESKKPTGYDTFLMWLKIAKITSNLIDNKIVKRDLTEIPIESVPFSNASVLPESIDLNKWLTFH
jgi:hypothetical protein